ncbi:MAG: endonuclease/exonuclease/phosphatase family protein [Candidatus Heimdallarchaeota archaeon]|nr:endonuclease/exonuclease/phosphatase family protein [Candidatus Heimdallarchaeota archaeon]
MKRVTIILLVAIICCSNVQSATSSDTVFWNNQQNYSTVISDEPLVLRVTTYNILQTGVYDEWRDVAVLENADILLLEETGLWRSTDDDDLQADLAYINAEYAKLGLDPYNHIDVSDDKGSSTGGQAIFSRYEITYFDVIYEYPLDDGTVHKYNHPLQHARVLVDGEEINTITVHFTCCDGGQSSRILEMEAAINYIDTFDGEAFLFAGDFNTLSNEDDDFILPGSDNLGDDPVSMLLGDESNSPENHTFFDVYRTLNPFDGGYTYVDAMYSSRIDFIFANEFFSDKLINSTVGTSALHRKGSDHFPLSAAFNLDPDLQDLRPPFKVNNLNATVSESVNTITWDKNLADDVDYYSVYRDSVKLGDVDNLTLEYIDGTVSANTIYTYTIRATDNSSNVGVFSNRLMINTSRGVLTVPDRVEITGEVGNHFVTLNWNVIDDGGLPVQYYYLYRTTESGMERGLFILYANLTTNTFTDDELLNDRAFYYKVIAFNELGRGLESDFTSFTPTGGETTSTTPTTSDNVETPTYFVSTLLALNSTLVILVIKRKYK